MDDVSYTAGTTPEPESDQPAAAATPPATPPPAAPTQPAPNANGPAIKKPVIIVVIFTILTLGFYSFYWVYQLRKNYNVELGKSESPVLDALLLLVPFVNLYILYKLARDTEQLGESSGTSPMSAALLFVLYIFTGLIGMGFIQHEANKIFDARHPGARDKSFGAGEILSFIPMMLAVGSVLLLGIVAGVQNAKERDDREQTTFTPKKTADPVSDAKQSSKVATDCYTINLANESRISETSKCEVIILSKESGTLMIGPSLYGTEGTLADAVSHYKASVQSSQDTVAGEADTTVGGKPAHVFFIKSTDGNYTRFVFVDTGKQYPGTDLATQVFQISGSNNVSDGTKDFMDAALASITWK